MGLFGKIRSFIGSNIGKARDGANYTIGKVKRFSQDIGSLTNEINKIVPIVSDIVDISADFIPYGSAVKTGLKLGAKGLGHIARFANIAESSANKAESVVNNPVQHFRQLVGD